MHRSARVASQGPHAIPGGPQLVTVCAPGATHDGEPPPTQHPPGHDVALHTHAPPWQVRPAAHAGPPPQRHWPPLHVSALLPHGAQLVPAGPHAVALGAVHTPAAQHPDGQLVASHTHAPLTQRCPVAQGALVPQPQVPFARQRSACVVLQVEHAAPELPQSAAVAGFTHAPLRQHPCGHDAAVQVHWPDWHTCPGAHAPPSPHAHVPPTQLGAVVALHVAQNAPPAPHWAALCEPGATHAPLAQQPEGQLDGSHPVHCWFAQPLGQLWQAAPPVPHSVPEVPARHTPCASQQPEGHEVASQVHAPLTHR